MTVAPADPADVRNWHRRDLRVTTSGQPSEAQLAAIAALGVRHVVNLGLHTHPAALTDEAASVEALGMRYTHIPVDFAAPTEADFACFCTAMAELGRTDPRPLHRQLARIRLLLPLRSRCARP